MAPADIVQTFGAYFSIMPPPPGRSGAIAALSFLLLMAFLDLERKKRYYHLLSHTVGDPTFRIEEIDEEIAEARIHRDLRWLLPFMLEAISHSTEIDSAAALAELETLGFLENKDGEIQISRSGGTLSALFRAGSMLCAVESAFIILNMRCSQVTVVLGGKEGLAGSNWGKTPLSKR